MSYKERVGLAAATSASLPALVNYRQVTRITAVAVAAAAIAAAASYFYQNAWQLLVTALSHIAVLSVYLLSARLVRRGQPAQAISAIAVALIASTTLTAVLTRGFLVNAGIWFGIALLAILRILTTRGVRNFIVTALLVLAALVGLDLVEGFARLDLSSTPGLTYLPGVLGGLTLTALLIQVLRSRHHTAPLTVGSQLLLAFTGVGAISLALIVGAIVWQTRVTLTAQTGQAFLALARSHSQRLAEQLDVEVGLLTTLANNQTFYNLITETARASEVASGSPAELAALLQAREEIWHSERDSILRTNVLNVGLNRSSNELERFASQFPAHVQLTLTDSNGALLAASGLTPEHYLYDHEPWWNAAWNEGAGALYAGNPQANSDTQASIINIAVPVYSPGRNVVVGILHSRFLISAFKVFADAAPLGITGELSLVDDTEYLYSDNPAHWRAALPNAVSVDIAANPFDWGIDPDEAGQRMIHSHAALLPSAETPYVEALGWTIIVQQTEAEALDTLGRLTQTAILGGMLALALVIITGDWLSQQVTRPIQTLTDIAAEMASGQPGRTAQLSGPTELRTLAQAFNSMTSQLHDLIGTLEQRVAARTQALETSAEVSRRLSTILSQRELVATVVDLVQTAFDYYHAHIYLFDDAGEFLVMVGGTGEAGRQLLAREHKIPRGKGLVGRAAERNAVVLVPDVSQEEDWLPNALLPQTKAEIAAPIAVGARVLGVLDVQHSVRGGLDEAAADMIQSIANQVAVALQNAQSYVAAQRQASREALINTIGQKILRTGTVEDALQVAVRELGRATGARETIVRLRGAAAAENGGRTSPGPHKPGSSG